MIGNPSLGNTNPSVLLTKREEKDPQHYEFSGGRHVYLFPNQSSDNFMIQIIAGEHFTIRNVIPYIVGLGDLVYTSCILLWISKPFQRTLTYKKNNIFLVSNLNQFCLQKNIAEMKKPLQN